MVILTPTDPIIGILSTEIGSRTEDALAWFDTVRHVEQLVNTEFTFVISTLCDARKEIELVNGEPVNVVKWYERNTRTFSFGRGGGRAFDKKIDDLRIRALFETMPDFPHQPTDALPTNQIFKVDDLTADIFLALRDPLPQVIEKIELKVTLFGFDKKCLDKREWSIR